MQIASTKIDLTKLKKTVVLLSGIKAKLAPEAMKVDKKIGGIVSAALSNSRYQGAAGELISVNTDKIPGVDRFIILGTGDAKNLTENGWRNVGIKLGKNLDAYGAAEAIIVMEALKGDKTPAARAAKGLVEGVELSLYRMDGFKTKQKPHQKAMFKKMTVQSTDVAGFKKTIPLLSAQTNGANLARDLVNLPPNIANPDYMVKEAKKLTKLGVKVQILGEKQMEKLGMNLLLAVGRAAEEESQLVIMKYMGDKKSKKTKCIAGKGVMFDTGGYNLKPSAGMAAMKSDMGGAAAVMGTMRALAESEAKVNVIGVVGCVVNKVGGNGFLPSDILTSYSGQTVEIGNTDAEGRLVLGDAISYILEKEKPDELIDLATLTGACMVALGAHYGGLFSNTDKISNALQASGQVTGERLWRMPIDDGYGVKSSLADLNNDGSRWGGASSAAVFIKSFVGKTPWAHLDIAGVAMAEKIPGGPDVRGASGFGVRLLVDYFTNA